MRLELPWPISANRYWQIAQGRLITTTLARNYKRSIAYQCVNQGIKPLAGYLSAELYLRPPDRRRRDCHNLTKVLFDALQGVAYADDSQICQVFIRMNPSDVVTNGRACLILSQLTTASMERWTYGSEC
jgi:Holliday junction resolvase RusA-like endonuclease